jgi:hypothetical protein
MVIIWRKMDKTKLIEKMQTQLIQVAFLLSKSNFLFLFFYFKIS